MGKDVANKVSKKNTNFESDFFDMTEVKKHQNQKERRKQKFESKKDHSRNEDKWR